MADVAHEALSRDVLSRDMLNHDVLNSVQQDFWQSPAAIAPAPEAPLTPAVSMAEACADCHAEFMIGARFCHACGLQRPMVAMPTDGGWVGTINTLRNEAKAAWSGSIAPAWRDFSFPRWMRYLHFHEIQRWVGLPTGSLIAFIIGLGCVAGAIGVSLFYKASNLAEFQAIQMWRIEWLLAATSSFVAGILLKKPSDQ